MKIFAYIKYSLLFFAKHSGLYILIILQLAFLLLTENILIANLNSRDVLYKPYENIISHDGYYFMQPYASDGIRDENGDMIKTNDEILRETLAKLKGSYKLYCFYHGTLEDKGINIRVIDDTVFSALSLPLEEGKHSKNACLVTKNNIGLKAGEEIDIDGAKIKISGVLTDKTYLPDYSLLAAEMSVEQLYQAYSFSKDFDSNDSDMQYMEYTEIIAPYSLLKECIENGGTILYRSGKMLIAFDGPLSSEDMAYNEQVLTAADCDEPGWLISFEQIRRKGEIYRSEDFYKMLPIVACILVVTIVGVVCSSAMISAADEKIQGALHKRRNVRRLPAYKLSDSACVLNNSACTRRGCAETRHSKFFRQRAGFCYRCEQRFCNSRRDSFCGGVIRHSAVGHSAQKTPRGKQY